MAPKTFYHSIWYTFAFPNDDTRGEYFPCPLFSATQKLHICHRTLKSSEGNMILLINWTKPLQLDSTLRLRATARLSEKRRTPRLPRIGLPRDWERIPFETTIPCSGAQNLCICPCVCDNFIPNPGNRSIKVVLRQESSSCKPNISMKRCGICSDPGNHTARNKWMRCMLWIIPRFIDTGVNC